MEQIFTKMQEKNEMIFAMRGNTGHSKLKKYSDKFLSSISSLKYLFILTFLINTSYEEKNAIFNINIHNKCHFKYKYSFPIYSIQFKFNYDTLICNPFQNNNIHSQETPPKVNIWYFPKNFPPNHGDKISLQCHMCYWIQQLTCVLQHIHRSFMGRGGMRSRSSSSGSRSRL